METLLRTTSISPRNQSTKVEAGRLSSEAHRLADLVTGRANLVLPRGCHTQQQLQGTLALSHLIRCQCSLSMLSKGLMIRELTITSTTLLQFPQPPTILREQSDTGFIMQVACPVHTRTCNAGSTIRAVPNLYTNLFSAGFHFGAGSFR
ncbi:hypothetical protein SAY86_004969 [Trapa natans]|uniref:Uncharacterized protein n=1 Tax=Trapa natans TaxID=22666 RepID=A0AAN7QSW7_TRANT|nr:hypothetical protein SAY86_004969 [Trapa natans]